jgi:hypothetical protein
VSEHRRGYPPATVTTLGLLGVTYEGNPVKRVPTSELTRLPEPYHSYEKPIAVEPPRKSAFEINCQPPLCNLRRVCAQLLKLIDGARVIAKEVHGSNELTRPLSDA